MKRHKVSLAKRIQVWDGFKLKRLSLGEILVEINKSLNIVTSVIFDPKTTWNDDRICTLATGRVSWDGPLAPLQISVKSATSWPYRDAGSLNSAQESKHRGVFKLIKYIETNGRLPANLGMLKHTIHLDEATDTYKFYVPKEFVCTKCMRAYVGRMEQHRKLGKATCVSRALTHRSETGQLTKLSPVLAISLREFGIPIEEHPVRIAYVGPAWISSAIESYRAIAPKGIGLAEYIKIASGK